MSVLFACIILKEKVTPKKCIAFLLSFIGVIIASGRDILSFNSSTLIGVGLCALAAVSYGSFTALTRRWQYDEELSLMISFFSSFILAAVINLAMGKKITLGAPEILGCAWNGIFVMAIATVTWALALKMGGTAKISNLAYLTPFISLIWTFFILKETIDPLSVLGLIVIILGIFIQLTDKKCAKI
jgi:drug/metabolite transporter (DMT)-like permease